MKSSDYWQLFMETGAPEMYLLYNSAKKVETAHVYYDSGIGASGYQL